MLTKEENEKAQTFYIVLGTRNCSKKIKETELASIFNWFKEGVRNENLIRVYTDAEMAKSAALKRCTPFDMPAVSFLTGTISMLEMNHVECVIFSITLPYWLELKQENKISPSLYEIPLTDLGVWFDYEVKILWNGQEYTAPKEIEAGLGCDIFNKI